MLLFFIIVIIIFIIVVIIIVVNFMLDKILAFRDQEEFNVIKQTPSLAVNEEKLLALTIGKYQINFNKIIEITGHQIVTVDEDDV